MVLSSFGAHSKLSEMASWLQKMKDSNISFSIRTYNSSCPTITSLLKDLKSVPLSMEDLKGRLQKDETLSVEQVIGYSVLVDALKWCPSEGKLDLHGMHLATAYLIMLKWVQVLRSRFRAGSWVTPTKFRVICGSEKHSSVKGESPGKALVKQMMVQMRSPMKIDPTNVGCFVGKGKAVRDWLRSGGWEREREREM
ncbi:PREDICTED: pentatricopeptide repeat-containing protein At2g17033-like [Nelumbo nucifera]|uniref:Pentatricopeptide repeat-containing protein At2g17033-like n=1 Tax=Nelumbo nucifera TaxID=4432 RepID=A0A1U8AWS9_NELNU|nr:PREDICTED: pentatricopeptide repeat-containing protein At2g17033-like [Nelumbo nucifera]